MTSPFINKKRCIMKKFIIDENGQAVVEFALVAPILLLILCGIIDFGWIFSAQIATDNCAREGARYASSCSDYSASPSQTADKVLSIASKNIKNNLSVIVTYSNASAPGAGDVSVRVISEVRALTFVAYTIFGGSTFNLESDVTMKVG